jgi:hypothetical protein
MKSERNQDTRIMEPRIECNAFVQKRVTFIVRCWNLAPSSSNSNESDVMVISLGNSIRNGVWCC